LTDKELITTAAYNCEGRKWVDVRLRE